jgi:protein-S-isoprenylcysteine O-methyltransferase Ste14
MSGQDHSAGEPVNARIFPIPPVVAGLFMSAGWALNWFFPLLDPAAPPPFAAQLAGRIVLSCSLAIAGLAFIQMIRARTTVHPGHNASALVRGGIYRFTRNPMYLSLTLLMLGLGFFFANPWMVLLAPALLLYFQERVVKREEAYLLARFGGGYLAYMAKVRRWI